jgi:DNA repair photolyase
VRKYINGVFEMNKAKGNMYFDISHTHNVIKGICPHGCSYCYMNKLYKKNWIEPKPLYFDEKEFNKNLGSSNFIFVGSSCDMWAENINGEWIYKTLQQVKKYSDNTYLFQSKNPKRFIEFAHHLPANCHIGTTIETNRIYCCMKNTPLPKERAISLRISGQKLLDEKKHFVTIEPILDFDLVEFLDLIIEADPNYVYIGADSNKNYLPEPPKEKIIELISKLEKFTNVKQKKNLRRLVA